MNFSTVLLFNRRSSTLSHFNIKPVILGCYYQLIIGQMLNKNLKNWSLFPLSPLTYVPDLPPLLTLPLQPQNP